MALVERLVGSPLKWYFCPFPHESETLNPKLILFLDRGAALTLFAVVSVYLVSDTNEGVIKVIHHPTYPLILTPLSRFARIL